MCEKIELGDKCPEIKVRKYRWVIVTLFGFVAGSSTFQNNQFTIIDNVIKDYYGATNFLLNLSQLVFMITLLIFLLPSIYFVEEYNLKFTVLLSAGLTFSANLLKLLALFHRNFLIIIVAQIVCGIAQVFLTASPAKVVTVWCATEEQNRACGIALWGGNIGLAMGVMIPILIVGNRTPSEIDTGLLELLGSNAIITGIILVAIILLFKSKPDVPPSIQQRRLIGVKTEYKKNLIELWKNKDFIKLVLIFACMTAVWTSFSILLNNIYLNSFPDDLSDLVLVTIVTTIIGGVGGNYLVGYILDKTLKYKLISFGVSFGLTLSYATVGIFLENRCRNGAVIALVSFGSFATSMLTVSIQYIVELTYPISDIITLSILYTLMSLFTIFFEVVFNIFADNQLFVLIHVASVVVYLAASLGNFSVSVDLKRSLVTDPERRPIK